MSVGTLAADIHPADADEIACESESVSVQHIELGSISENNDEPSERPAHDHHAHNCGTCHLHVVGSKVSQLSFALPMSHNFRLGGDQAAPRAGPLGLYRPPRA